MDYWLIWYQARADQVTAIARAVEQLGFAGIALPDHVAIPQAYTSVHPSGERFIEYNTPYPDALITIAAMAAVTTRLQFMTYVYVLPMRDPFSVAKQAATLAMQSKYRLVLGVGAGWMTEEIALLGHPARGRDRRMDEMISIMRDFWQDGLATFRGQYYQFDTAGQFPVPEQRIPVWVGGKSDAALRRAARNDGWAGMNYPLQEVRALLVKLDAERRRHLDRGGDGSTRFHRFVIPNAEPSLDLYRQLEDWGVDATLAPVSLQDQHYTSFEGKLDAMQRFADRYIRR